METDKCKICGSNSLTIFAHTARCSQCEVLLYYPYPEKEGLLRDDLSLSSLSPTEEEKRILNKVLSWHIRNKALSWYGRSSFYNHTNFTNMLRFCIDESYTWKNIDILDYGGFGGQFSLICKSHFPQCQVFITDINDESLLDEWKCYNNQILFKDFDNDNTNFDFIFLNNVLEHISDPVFVLNQLSSKLKDGGKICIDTPKKFWIYPLSKLISKTLYTKVLKGTVNKSHLQVWSRKSFELVVRKCGLRIIKYAEKSEYTMPTTFYMSNMGIKNPLIRLAGRIFYSNAKWLAKNKIVCVLSLAQV
ncbi:MAG: class I SAM-dependent methyltransferase [Candidatus Hodarchaeota archaeon]